MGNSNASVAHWQGNVLVLVCGLSQSGKSKVMYYLCNEGSNATIPQHSGFERKHVNYQNHGLVFVGMQGDCSRNEWNIWLPKTKCLHFVVRTPCEPFDLLLAKNYLFALLKTGLDVPICIIQNHKQDSDIAAAVYTDKIVKAFDLSILRQTYKLLLKAVTYDDPKEIDVINAWTVKKHSLPE